MTHDPGDEDRRPGGPFEPAPKHCPRCGRTAHFRYTNTEEAASGSSLCWGETDNCTTTPAQPVKGR